MKKEVKEKWLEALRSGKYTQTSSVLRDSADDGKYGYCCLGVLCDIYAQENDMKWEGSPEAWQIHGVNQVLPKEVQEWAGLDDENPGLKYKTKYPENYDKYSFEDQDVRYMFHSDGDNKTSLAEVNDEWSDYGFSEIANLIEEFM